MAEDVKGKRCQVCGTVTKRRRFNNGYIGYCNDCESCGKVVCLSCVDQLRDVGVAGDFWLCECGAPRIKVRRCRDLRLYD